MPPAAAPGAPASGGVPVSARPVRDFANPVRTAEEKAGQREAARRARRVDRRALLRDYRTIARATGTVVREYSECRTRAAYHAGTGRRGFEVALKSPADNAIRVYHAREEPYGNAPLDAAGVAGNEAYLRRLAQADDVSLPDLFTVGEAAWREAYRLRQLQNMARGLYGVAGPVVSDGKQGDD